jgi:hypothetical protein
MTNTAQAPFEVSPRREGEPEADLLGMTLIHRAMRCGARTLARAVTTEPTAPGRRATGRRRAAVRFGRELLGEIHLHHEREDDVLWPVIAASAGAAVDLRPLSDDHDALGPLLERAERLLVEFRDGAPNGPAVHLANALNTLADALDEHIGDEEAVVFPVIRRYVSAGDFAQCERMFQKGNSIRHLAFVLPWLMAHATDQERDEGRARAGLQLRILVRLTTPGYRRLIARLS